MTTELPAPIFSIPTWHEVMKKAELFEELNDIEQFIWDNEPEGLDDERDFRAGLSKALRCAYAQGQRDLIEAMQLTAYSTLNEDNEPAMLFFDHKEAGLYCDLGEAPIPLYRLPEDTPK